MNETILKEKIKQYCDRLKKWQVEQKKMDRRKGSKGTEFNKEENTKIKFIIPLLEILGWDWLQYDVEFEHHIPKIKGRDAADMALYTSDKEPLKPTILIEVKPIKNDIIIDKLHRPTKIFEYMTHGNVKYGIATNGRQLFLFDNRHTRHDSDQGCLLINFRSLDDLINYSDVLTLLSKKMVSTGKLKQFSDYFHKTRPFFSWRKSRKIDNKDHDEYTLRLDFARDFLKNESKKHIS